MDVAIHRPAGKGLQKYAVEFKAAVAPGTAPGTYLNEANVFDKNITLGSCVAHRETYDTDDHDGDGDTTEWRCNGNISFTVVETAAMQANKWVKGDLDTEWSRNPRCRPGLTRARRHRRIPLQLHQRRQRPDGRRRP